jgi:hypothetical protein
LDWAGDVIRGLMAHVGEQWNGGDYPISGPRYTLYAGVLQSRISFAHSEKLFGTSRNKVSLFYIDLLVGKHAGGTPAVF